ncbi:formyltransferase family protein [uncultured Fusobacterium sp.]|uniref:formyltransferase family protein n=1 Tax=uncultured Fusobacterium sp. TaxID=159267 RepID=UPI0025935DED|nr:formyltransferase family protein [uncultured Fusobacterium sp.]
MNIAFYISRKGGRVEKFLKKNIELRKKVKVIISDGEDNLHLKDFFEELDIKYIYINFESLSLDKKERNERLSDVMLKILKENKIDYCITFGKHILKGKLLKDYENRLINIHAALLPSYRGRKPIDQAVSDNAFIVGSTAHFIDEGTDTGPIILNVVQNMEGFYEGGYDKILDSQLLLLEKLFLLLEENRITLKDKKVKIIGANYNYYMTFPKID